MIATVAVAAAAMLAAPLAYAQAPQGEPTGYVAGEQTLESRLLAPCCWAQPLDVHESDITRQLRSEIRRRLTAGEAPAVIEEDMISRYGEKMRAMPEGKTLTGLGVWLSIAFVVLGVGAVALVVRWVKRGKAQKLPIGEPVAKTSAGPDEWDDRLDNELRNVDD